MTSIPRHEQKSVIRLLWVQIGLIRRTPPEVVRGTRYRLPPAFKGARSVTISRKARGQPLGNCRSAAADPWGMRNRFPSSTRMIDAASLRMPRSFTPASSRRNVADLLSGGVAVKCSFSST